MKLSRRRLFASLAGLASLAAVIETDGASRIGVGHTAAIDTADSKSVLSLSFEESSNTLTIDSTLKGGKVMKFNTERITVRPDPSDKTIPVTVAVKADGHDEDTITVRVEKEDIRVETEHPLVL
ncbi:hypothetical protein [Natronolimnohabitans innermongolicus]|nr:hypothetical protein [Natronolimnohabitans innermongolicus]